MYFTLHIYCSSKVIALFYRQLNYMIGTKSDGRSKLTLCLIGSTVWTSSYIIFLDHDNGTEQELAYCAAIVYPWSHYVWNQASDLEVEELKKEITQLFGSDERFSDFAWLVEDC